MKELSFCGWIQMFRIWFQIWTLLMCLLFCCAEQTISLYNHPLKSPCKFPLSKQTYVRDPKDCSVFYTCYGNRYWKLSCNSPYTVYSLKYKVCVWKYSPYDDCEHSKQNDVVVSPPTTIRRTKGRVTRLPTTPTTRRLTTSRRTRPTTTRPIRNRTTRPRTVRPVTKVPPKRHTTPRKTWPTYKSPFTPKPTWRPTYRPQDPSFTRRHTKRPTYRPVTSRPTLRPVTSRPTYRPITPRPTFRPVTSRPTFRPVTSRPTFRPVWSKPTYRPVRSWPTYRPVTPRPIRRTSWRPIPTRRPTRRPVTPKRTTRRPPTRWTRPRWPTARPIVTWQTKKPFTRWTFRWPTRPTRLPYYTRRPIHTVATTTTPVPTTTTATTTTTTTPIPTTPSTTPSTTTTTAKPKPTKPKRRTFYQDRCGVMSTPLIIGGSLSQPRKWPWQVSLQIIAAVDPWHRCGGVLIHEMWVLTAAHCVEGSFYGDLRNWRVVIAAENLEIDTGREIYRRIQRIISHPGYIRTSNFPNDIALLQLDEPVDIESGESRVACIPDPQDQMDLVHNSRCWISGWGETRDTGGVENSMNELNVEVIPNWLCSSMWRRVGIHVLDSQVCVGYGDTGACYGDSGGPLMCEVEGRYYVTGVMSWLVSNCSAMGFPNVFTRVPSYLDWIYEKLEYYDWWRYK